MLFLVSDEQMQNQSAGLFGCSVLVIGDIKLEKCFARVIFLNRTVYFLLVTLNAYSSSFFY